jgi:branched-chain amino acid transport system substrate-binding protein
MIRSQRARALALLAAVALVVAACSSDKKTSTAGGSSGSSASSGGAAAGAYKVDTSSCPSDVNDKISGTLKIGTTMPLSGGAAAAAFAPVAAGLKAYITDANTKNLVPGVKLELSIEDDQFNPTLTTPAVEKLRDQTGVNLLTGMIGTANGLAVRDSLNRDCVPQLFNNSGDPRWGQAKRFPWSTGILAPYNTETAIYVEDIKTKFPNGTTAAVFNVNSDFGQDYKDTFQTLASEAKINIVDAQTIEGTDSSPPTSQVTSIASKKPEVILAVPLGAQCISFLTQLANAKATTTGWNPRVYITATCASTLLLGLAGAAADGIITVVTGIDVADPKNAAVPSVVAYKAVMASAAPEVTDLPTAGAGWTVGEVTVEVLKQAAASPDGLTRASIINAARNLSFHPSLVREGITFKSTGELDPYVNEVQQVVQYNAATKTYADIGGLITKFEGKTAVPN